MSTDRAAVLTSRLADSRRAVTQSSVERRAFSLERQAMRRKGGRIGAPSSGREEGVKKPHFDPIFETAGMNAAR